MITTWWNQVSATAAHGLQITVVGMLLVFFTLGLIIISMVLLTQLPWLKAQEESDQDDESAPAAPLEQASSVPQTADDELAQVAAIAVALAIARQKSRPITRGLSRPHIRPTGGWKLYGRTYQIGL